MAWISTAWTACGWRLPPSPTLSRDHFDYHGSMEAYFEAKARLFRDLLPEGGKAVLNADIPEFPRASRHLQGAGSRGDDVRFGW